MKIKNKIQHLALVSMILSSTLAHAGKRPRPPELGVPAPPAAAQLMDERPELPELLVPRARQMQIQIPEDLEGDGGVAPAAGGGGGGGGGGAGFEAFLGEPGISPGFRVKKGAALSEVVAVKATPPRKLNQVARGDGKVSYDYSGQMGFEPGDFLYGLQSAREATLEVFKSNPHLAGRALTIDVFNKFIWFKLRSELGIFTIRPEETDRQISDAVFRDELAESDRDRVNHYYSDVLRLAVGSGSEEEFYRAACVEAISYSHHRGRKIHFILDQLDFDEIGNPAARYHQSYTNYELRGVLSLYQKDPMILRTVIFYRAGERLNEEAAIQVLQRLRSLVS